MFCHCKLDCLDAVAAEAGVRPGKGLAELGDALVGFPADLYPVDSLVRNKDADHVGPEARLALQARNFCHHSLHSGG